MTVRMELFLLGAALTCAATALPEDKSLTSVGRGPGIVGSWRLVSHEERKDDGTVVAVWGASPSGRLIYDAGGRMAVQLMNPDRKPFAAPDRLAGTAEEVNNAFAGYIAYYGSYSVDPVSGVVVHRVEGSLFPNWIGTELKRSFRLEGRRLQLSTPPRLVGGRTSTFVLVWERED